MNGDLISRSALLEKAVEVPGALSKMVSVWDIVHEPAVEAAPVVSAQWEHLGGDEWCCTACGNVITTEGSWEKPTKKYCDECGAKMILEAD